MSLKPLLCFFRVLLFGTLLSIASTPLAADTVLIDDDFSPEDSYTFVSSFNHASSGFNPVDGSYAVDPEFNPSDGNPGGALSLTHFHDVERDEDTGLPVDPNGETQVFSFLRNDSTSYNPFAQGAFDTVTFTFDYKTNDDSFDSVFAHMRDGGGNGAFAGLGTEIVADGNWHTFSQTFTDNDFAMLFDFSGGTNASYEFGFGFESNLVVPANDLGEISVNILVDNFSVTLASSVPPLLGDVDLDGTVTFLDISPFIAILSAGGFQAEADTDQNGVVDFLDIQPFIGILAGN